MPKEIKVKDEGLETSSLNILAFDTSSTACSIILQSNDRVFFTHEVAPMQQAKLILSEINSLLEKAQLSLHQLDAIAYGCGPGSFTGIRIANSVAQGIGFVAKKPLIPISSLAATAQAAFLEHGYRNFLVAVDARMDQIYWAIYKINKNEQVELIGKEEVYNPGEVTIPADENGEEIPWCGIGDGWGKYPDQLVKALGFNPIAIYPSQIPTAQAVLTLAKAKFAKKEWITAEEAFPTYLR